MQLYMLDIEYGLSTNCAPNDVLITLGNTSAQSLTITSKVGFQTMIFINFDQNDLST